MNQSISLGDEGGFWVHEEVGEVEDPVRVPVTLTFAGTFIE